MLLCWAVDPGTLIPNFEGKMAEEPLPVGSASPSHAYPWPPIPKRNLGHYHFNVIFACPLGLYIVKSRISRVTLAPMPWVKDQLNLDALGDHQRAHLRGTGGFGKFRIHNFGALGFLSGDRA